MLCKFQVLWFPPIVQRRVFGTGVPKLPIAFDWVYVPCDGLASHPGGASALCPLLHGIQAPHDHNQNKRMGKRASNRQQQVSKGAILFLCKVESLSSYKYLGRFFNNPPPVWLSQQPIGITVMAASLVDPPGVTPLPPPPFLFHSLISPVAAFADAKSP